MTGSNPQRLPGFWLSLLIGVLASSVVPDHAAAQHRARLSQGLEARLAKDAGPTDVVVQGPQAEVDRISRTYGVKVVKRLDMGAVLSASGRQVAAIASDDNVGALTADDVVVSTMAVTAQSTGASQLWAGLGRNFGGLTGAGIGIAVIDSGIGLHRDVDRRVVRRVDFVDPGSGTADGYGHGTHVAGIIAGSGAGSRSSGGSAYVGIAPGAGLVGLRVLGADGTGLVSDVILAIEWAIKNKRRYNLRVVNISLGKTATETYDVDPMAQAVERAVAEGLVVVTSAGNLGKTEDWPPDGRRGGLAWLHAGRVDGRRVEHARHRRAIRRRGGELQLAGAGGRSGRREYVGAQAGSGGAGQRDCRRRSGGQPPLGEPRRPPCVRRRGRDVFQSFRLEHGGGGRLRRRGADASGPAGADAAQVKFALQVTAERMEGFGFIEQGAGSLNVPLAVALATSDDFASAPSSVQIGGEMAFAGGIAFLSKSAHAKPGKHSSCW